MKGDFSRETFNRAAHYSAVRLQQGRVVTDADWNEQADLTRYRAERVARDAFGAASVPLEAAGFTLRAETRALAVRVVNANVVWVLAEDGLLLATANGGADWAPVELLNSAQRRTAAHLRSAAEAGGVGWLVGEGGLVMKTSDQGLSWTAQDAGTLAELRGVAVFDADHAWAVGDGGTVVGTDDCGAHWFRVVADAARLSAVRFIDPFNGVAVGQGGAILGTNDGGHTWTRRESGSTAHLRALAGIGTALLWVAGQGGVILRSADFGATWLPCTTSSSADLQAIAFRDAAEGWAAGVGGVLLHSVDGGVSWIEQDAGTTQTLRGMSSAAGEVWAVGDGGTALRLDGGSPDVVPAVLPAAGLSIGPGRCYVEGVLCELEAWTSYAHQPDGGVVEPLAPGAHLVYLNAWQRHISALEAPYIREVALGGPDTATRARTVAQVRTLPLAAGSPFDWQCDSDVEAWDALINAPRPRLAARAEPELAAANLCDIAATAGYRRLENQLYRVEVHEGGAVATGTPQFKFSRENGSVAYAVVSLTTDAALQQTVVRLAARGRDANLDLAAHDRVELCDDDSELGSRRGVMLEYLNDGDDELELVLAGVPGSAWGAIGRDPAKHPVLRRWDQRPAGAALTLPIVEGSWTELEEGVQVRFEPGGQYRPGDYWLVPARTISADVEWPRDADGDPLPREPAGITDAYCRLGIVEVDAWGAITVTSDCREIFPPLTGLRQLLYVSGDGQQALANAPLAHPLEARVAAGSLAQAGVSVWFTVDEGGGTLVGPNPAITGADGVASIGWRLGSAPRQRVSAELQVGDSLQRLSFNANLAQPPVTASGGGCEITIGPRGQVAQLDSRVLARLLREAEGNLCLCFMPGVHVVNDLEVQGTGRLALHGCGRASQVRLGKPITLSGFRTLDIADLAIELQGNQGLLLDGNEDVSLSHLQVSPARAAARPVLRVTNTGRLRVADCVLRATGAEGLSGQAAVFDTLQGDVHIASNRFDGALSFYGEPLNPDELQGFIARMRQLTAEMNLAPKEARLFFADNNVALLTIGERMARQLIDGRGEAVFASAVLQGNTFSGIRNVFASHMLAFSGNTFSSGARDGQTFYGVMAANRATAVGNLAELPGDEAILFFATRRGDFEKVANRVFIQP